MLFWNATFKDTCQLIEAILCAIIAGHEGEEIEIKL